MVEFEMAHWQPVDLDGPPPRPIWLENEMGELGLTIRTPDTELKYTLTQVWSKDVNCWINAILRQHMMDGVVGPQEYALLPEYVYGHSLPDLALRFVTAMHDIFRTTFMQYQSEEGNSAMETAITQAG